ncbi:hypothetical protein A2U01_0050881, partial [Trifolium medium]|nr:hypothetical protein [Trifolium medium]
SIGGSVRGSDLFEGGWETHTVVANLFGGGSGGRF